MMSFTEMISKRHQRYFLLLVLMGIFVLVIAQFKLSSFKCMPSTETPSALPIQVFRYNRKYGGKWIVTSSVRSLNVTNIPGWSILVYGDVSQKCSPPICIHLDNELKYSEKPTGLTREITAYLVATSYRPSFIFTVTEWQDDMSQVLDKYFYNEFASGIVAKTNRTLIDSQTIFSQGPGQDLYNASISSGPNKNSYDFILKENLHPLIQTVVQPEGINSERVGNRASETISSLPSVFLPIDTFTSLDFEMTLFRPDAFWALILKHVYLGDLLSQRLLWEVEGLVMVFPNGWTQTVKQLNNSNLGTYLKHPQHMELIEHFTCKKNLNILDCLGYVNQLMRGKGLINIQTETDIKSWIFNLKSVGYQSPRRSQQVRQKPKRMEQTLGIFSHSKGTRNIDIPSLRLKTICPGNTLHRPNSVIRDITLIITFNEPSLYRNIPLLEIMYRPYFQHIIYCGPKMEQFRMYANNVTGYFIYIEALKRGWYYMFECTSEAMKLNLNVKGFVQIGDDTLLNSWNLIDLPRDKIWLTTGIRSSNASLVSLKPNWIWWKDGRRRLINLLKEISNERLYHKENEIEFTFLENFRNNSKNFTNFFKQGCDFMYVPMKLKDVFVKFANLLIKHQVMLELGFPNIALGLQRWEDVHFVEDGGLWKNRPLNKKIYRPDMIYLHPFKLKKELSSPKGRNFFCNVYMENQKNVSFSRNEKYRHV